MTESQPEPEQVTVDKGEQFPGAEQPTEPPGEGLVERVEDEVRKYWPGHRRRKQA